MAIDDRHPTDSRDEASVIDLGRRRFLAGAAAAVPVMALGSLGAPAWASTQGTPKGVPVRRSIGALAANDPYVQLFKDGVTILRKRSARNPLDPTGWDSLSVQHALFCSSVSHSLQVHWGWDFLTWHRVFLWSLERVMRDALKEKQFALPYWDATRYRRIPAAYWGKDNPLYDTTREMGPDDELPDDFLDVEGALSLESFYAFGGYPYDNPSGDMIEGNLEQSFHNNVHNWVGGNMGMFATAGFESLFSAHHGNVDRMWEKWRSLRGPSADPREEAWRTRSYEIVNEKGRRETIAVKDLVDTRKLDYVFDNYDFQARQLPDPVLSDGTGVTLAVQGSFKSAARTPRVLRFERSSVAIHPLCCRAFLRSKSDRNHAAYVGTFTVLPVQRGGARGLDRNVVMQLALSNDVRQKFSGAGDVEVVIVGVALKGRNIPLAPVPLAKATLADGIV
jgi:hypothetical protein